MRARTRQVSKNLFGLFILIQLYFLSSEVQNLAQGYLVMEAMKK